MRQIVARLSALSLLAIAVFAFAHASPSPATITVGANCILVQAINAANVARGYSGHRQRHG